jgi:hypothetical protein
MPKYITLQIINPCEQKWDNMTEVQNGRHCNACQKTVIDFTSMTDSQIVAFFKTNKKNTCGQFLDTQLNAPMAIPPKEIPWLKYFFTITIPAMLFSLKASAQKIIKPEKTEIVSKQNSLQPIILQPKNIEKEIPYQPKVTLLEEVKVETSVTTRSTRYSYAGGVSVLRSKSFENKKINKTAFKNLADEVKIYPNPILPGGKLTIQFLKEINANQLVEIFAVDGRIVQKEIIPVILKTQQIFFNINNFQKGVYAIKITHLKTGEKLVKQMVVL